MCRIENYSQTFDICYTICTQVALVDVLKAMGLEPDGAVGHSVGELTCDYADGGITAEETVIGAYWGGRTIKENNLPPGGMAAVGLSWAEAEERCPDGVMPACHNAPDTITVSGHAAGVSKMVADLTAEGIFAKEVECSGVPFHSSLMETCRSPLLNTVKKVREPYHQITLRCN